MVKVYVEGGGKDCKTDLRRAFHSFFQSAGIKNKPKVIACGSRNEAFKDFCRAFNYVREGEEVLLLVDSEKPISQPDVLSQLKSSDNWSFPTNVNEGCIHLMVQTMETWLIADPDALCAYYGSQFDKDSISFSNDLESIPKKKVYSALVKAAKNTPKGKYDKGDHSFDILSMANAELVCKQCSYANRFIEKLQVISVIEELKR